VQNRAFFRIIAPDGSLIGSSDIRARQSGTSTIIENMILYKNVEKKILAKLHASELKHAQVESFAYVGGRTWKSTLWISPHTKRFRWVVLRKKLNKTWKEELHFAASPLLSGIGVLVPFFQSPKTNFFDVDNGFGGKVRHHKKRWTEKLEFVPFFSPLNLQFPEALIEYSEVGVEKVTLLPHNWKLVRALPESPFAPITERPRPRITLNHSSEEPAGIEAKIQIRTHDHLRLFGTLEEPRGNPNSPLLLLIHGSGAENQDSGCGYEGRDICVSKILPFRELSRKLVQRGLAVFRYDKRGIGKSEGKWNKVNRQDLLRDVISIARYFKKTMPERRIFLVGFSEGGTLAISAALRIKGLNGIVLAGCPANRIDHLYLTGSPLKSKQMKIPKEEVARLVRNLKNVFKHIRSIDQKRGRKPISLQYEGKSFDWWAEHLAATPPKVEARSLKVPVLLLHGDQDWEVVVEESYILEKALRKARMPLKVLRFRGLNHFFTKSEPRNPGFEYEIPCEISERVPKSISNWIRDLS
jgi:uncharacterized protein